MNNPNQNVPPGYQQPQDEFSDLAALAQMSKQPTARDIETANWSIRELVAVAEQLSKQTNLDNGIATDKLLAEIWLRVNYLQEQKINAKHTSQYIMLKDYAERLAAAIERIYAFFPFKNAQEIAKSLREE